MLPVSILPVIFCGGKSSRMGQDKGLLPASGGNWAIQAASHFAGADEVIISVQQHQLSSYSAFFSQRQLVTDNPALGIAGPLAALLSVHEKFPAADLFVLACDLKQMTRQVIDQLLSLYQQRQGFDAFLLSVEDEVEPLCGIYCSNGLKKISGKHQLQQLERTSMKYIINLLNSYIEPTIDKVAFVNFNSPDDLNRQ
jgi:molybdenum cofactor guanylyltransferase